MGLSSWRLGIGLTLGLALLTCATASPVAAQEAAAVPGRIAFSHVGIAQGLSSARTVTVAQDPVGYLWVGTTNGLNRYDGYAVKTYRNDPLDPQSLSGTWVQTLYVGHDGRLWVGTAAGLDVYDPNSDTFRRDPAGLGGEVVSAIYQDRSGVMWLGTRNSGVYRFDPNSRELTSYRPDANNPRSLSSNGVQKITADRSGTIWIGTMAGLDRFDPADGGFTVYRHDDADPSSLSYDVVWDILDDQSGTLWVGTDGGGLNAFDPTTNGFVHYRRDPTNPRSLTDDRVSCLAQDARGGLVVGTFTGGLIVLDRARQNLTLARHRSNDPFSLVNDTVFGCVADSSGLVWLATAGGLDFYDPLRQVVSVDRPGPDAATSLASENISAVYEDPRGRRWVGTIDQGLDLVNRMTGQVTHYPASANGPGLRNPYVTAITSDATGKLWIGTYGGGLYRFDPESQTFTSYRREADNPRSLSDDAVTDVLVASDGSIWVSTRAGGVSRIEPDSRSVTQFRHDRNNPNSLTIDAVRALAEDTVGNIWAGLMAGGLDRISPTTGDITHFKHDGRDSTSIGDDNVYALWVDHTGALWAGFQGGGLDMLPAPATGRTFTHFRQRDGLASDEVTAIVEDQTYNLWIATGRGLSRLDPERRTLRTFGADAGLPSAPFTRARAVSDTGRLLFGSFAGLIELDARGLQDDASIPPIVLTDFLLSNQHVAPNSNGPLRQQIDVANTVQVNWDQRVISIQFAALSYRVPTLNRYRYILEGFDQQWTEVDSSRRLVTYTNLDPGTYVFRVTGSNASGVWNPDGRALTLIVSPPWWGTWWFRAFLLVLLVGGLGLTYMWRVRTLRDQQRRLERLVAQRTEALEAALGTRDVFLRTLAHDLKAPLISLGWYVQLLKARIEDGALDQASLTEGLQAIGSGAGAAVAAVDELHDLIRLEAGAPVPLQRERIDLPAFVDLLVAGRVTSEREQFQVEVRTPGLMVDADRARLARVLDNLFDNAIKYSPAGSEIHVQIERATDDGNDWAVVRVQDAGMGIPASDLPHVFERYQRGSNAARIPGEGIGLASVRMLVELHGGHVDVESVEGQGTTFTVRLPLERVSARAPERESVNAS